MSLSAQKPPHDPHDHGGFNALKPKVSFSSTNISNVWGPEPEINLYSMDYSNIKPPSYHEESPKPPQIPTMYGNFLSMNMNESPQAAPFYPQSFYPKVGNTNHNMGPSNNGYSNYNGMYGGGYMHGGNQFQNYQYMQGQKPDYFMNQDDLNYTFGTMRPHFFSQTNIEEKSNFHGGNSFKKNTTPKKNSLVMKNGNFSTPNGFGDRGDSEMDFNVDAKNLFDFCKDQLGSRKIQMFFEKGGEEEKEAFFLKIEAQLLFLIKDVFGNYVVQKMLEKGYFLNFLWERNCLLIEIRKPKDKGDGI